MRIWPLIQKILTFFSKFIKEHIDNEHFIPLLGLELTPYLQDGQRNRTALHHLSRYYWALDVIAGERGVTKILDAGCGSGYGSYIIAKAFPHIQVHGIDYDAKAIATAKTAYSLPNLHYLHGDLQMERIPFIQHPYKCIISFDTIEHLNNREIVLENIVNLLSEDGIFLFSTPCGHEQIVFNPKWPAHKIEYSYKLLYKFLRRYFGETVGADQIDFPKFDVFNKLIEANVPYNHTFNPVICRKPIIIQSPYTDIGGLKQ